MYRPDTVLKCGGSNPFGAGDAASIAVIDSATANVMWNAISVPKMPDFAGVPESRAAADGRGADERRHQRGGRVTESAAVNSGRHAAVERHAGARARRATLPFVGAFAAGWRACCPSGGSPSETHGTVYWHAVSLQRRRHVLPTRPVITDLPDGSIASLAAPVRVSCDTAAAIGIAVPHAPRRRHAPDQLRSTLRARARSM